MVMAYLFNQLKLKDFTGLKKIMTGQFFLGYNSKTFKKKYKYNDRGACGK